MSILLAGDVGGTKTLLGLFDGVPARPRPIAVSAFTTLDYPDLPAMITTFLDAVDADATIDAACFGVAGPVIIDTAELTNVPWRVDARVTARRFNIPHVHLLNDLEALAYSVPALDTEEVLVLQAGDPVRHGSIAVIAAGTGLGEAMLHNVDGRFRASATEGGHADFAARTDRDIRVLRSLTERLGRAEVEQVLSGRGLTNIHRALNRGDCSARIDLDDPAAPAAISTAALEGRCAVCVETLGLFAEAYGAEAGNLALRTAAIGGVFIGGGIAPKILPALTSGAFMRAFLAKQPLQDLLARMPVKVILNTQAGLLGAALFAAGQ